MNFIRTNRITEDNFLCLIANDNRLRFAIALGDKLYYSSRDTYINYYSNEIPERENAYQNNGSLEEYGYKDISIIETDKSHNIYVMEFDNENLTPYQQAEKERLLEGINLYNTKETARYNPGDVCITKYGEVYLYIGKMIGEMNLELDNVECAKCTLNKEHFYLIINYEDVTLYGENLSNWNPEKLEESLQGLSILKSKKSFSRIIENPFDFFYQDEEPMKRFILELNPNFSTYEIRQNFKKTNANTSDTLRNMLFRSNLKRIIAEFN